MLQFRGTFEKEKNALHELNQRLREYLSRVKQLEEENSFLMTEIKSVRQEKTYEWESEYKAELRELRRTVNQLSFEKSKAEMERQKLWRELKMVQALCCEESALCRDVDAELRACEKQLKQAHKTNLDLEDRLRLLENECKCVEDTHSRQVAELRSQVRSRAWPVFHHKSQAVSPAVRMDEVEKWALSLSDTWREAVDVYRLKIEDLEKSLRSDEAKLEELRKEKMLHASESRQLCLEVEKQKQRQVHLEEQLVSLQESCRAELDRYEAIMDDLEQEWSSLSNTIAEKLKDHQELMQVKMGLSLEVAAYRALLEGERKDGLLMSDLNTRETSRIIDIKVSPHPYTLKRMFKPRKHEGKAFPVNRSFDGRYMEPTSRMTAYSRSIQNRSSSTTRIVPITFCGSRQHSSSRRMDLPLFTSSSQAVSSMPSHNRENTDVCNNITESTMPDRSQCSTEDLAYPEDSGLKVSSLQSPPTTVDNKSVTVMSSLAMSEVVNAQDDKERTIHIKVEKEENDTSTLGAEIRGNTQDFQNVTAVTQDCIAGNHFDGQVSSQSQIQDKDYIKESYTVGQEFPGEGRVLESVSMEEIIEKVMKPAGLDAKVSSPPDSKFTYYVEKSGEENGTAKTQIILQATVQEDVDISDESVLEQLLSKDVKKVALEDIKGTPTGSMIENLLSLGLQGDENIENKSINVEIIEEPLEQKSCEENKVKTSPTFVQPSSMFFQIEEVENERDGTKYHDDQSETSSTPLTAKGDDRKNDSIQNQESSRDLDSLVFDQDHETEYFVSTPDDDISEPDEGIFSSIGHYGVVDDLSDERYYQEESPVNLRFEEAERYRAIPKMTYVKSEHTFNKERFPECIIEEEVQVSPTIQESMPEFLQEDSIDLKGQVVGALEMLQETVSGSLKEELALFTKNDQEPLNSIAVKSVEQAADNGTVTIVAELSASQTLEDSGMLEGQGKYDRLEDKLMDGSQTSSVELQQIISSGVTVSGTDREYLLSRVHDGKVVEHSEQEGFPTHESITKVNKTEKHIKLGPSEKSFTFQMDISSLTPASSSSDPLESQGLYSLAEKDQEDSIKEMTENRCGLVEMKTSNEKQDKAFNLYQAQEGMATNQESCSTEHVGFSHFVQTYLAEPQLQVHQEKRIATVYLESQKDN